MQQHEASAARMRVLVTGASSGIGRATALRLARDGGAVALVSRQASRLHEVAEAVERAGGRAVVLPADLGQAAERGALVAQAQEALGGLDGLVNAAGVIASGGVEQTPLADWEAMFALNVSAPFHLLQLATPALVASRGAVVNVSSVTGLRAFPGLVAYCTSKAALDQLTRCAALELAGRGVRVNAVNPGVVVTELHLRGGMDLGRYEAFLEHSRTTHPLGRVAQPEEVAATIAWLLSAEASFITGVTLPVDGGRQLTCAR